MAPFVKRDAFVASQMISFEQQPTCPPHPFRCEYVKLRTLLPRPRKGLQGYFDHKNPPLGLCRRPMPRVLEGS